MKKTKLLCCAFAAAALCGFADEDYVRHVVTLTGSVGEGHTFPGASYPFGMIQPGPDSGTAIWCSGYQNTDKTIRGISQTHLNGTGCPSMGDILLMPYTGVTDGVDYSSPYSGQQCAPDRYAVTFDRFGVKAAATCSEHVSWLTFDYGKTATKKMFVDCASTLLQTWRAKFGQVIPESDYALSEDRTEISGTRHCDTVFCQFCFSRNDR